MTRKTEKPLVRIVDDDPDQLASLEIMLSAEGWDVACYERASDFFAEDTPSRPGCLILDVRMPGECARGGIPGAVNIPLDTLREHLSELPKDRKIIVSCAVGLRGYLGTRILRQHGFDAVNLSGGYRIYSLYSRLQGK